MGDLLDILNETKSLFPLQELKRFLTNLKSLYLSRYFTFSSEITSNSFMTRTLLKDRVSVRRVKILVFLPKASTNVSKMGIFQLTHLALVCNVPVQINSTEMIKKSPQMTLTILIFLVGRLMVTKSPTANGVR